MNKLFDPAIFGQLWMMSESEFDGMVRAARMMTPDAMAAIVLNGNAKRPDPPKPYTVRDGVAVISIRGTVSKESYYWSYYYDSSVRTYGDIVAAANMADADPEVRTKLLDIDSNGGTVAGCFECMAALKKSAEIKPFYTFANSNMKSGALLLGSIGKTIAGTKSTEIGSIGVVTQHVNESELNKKIGIEVKYLTAGKYKAFGNPDEALSPEAEAYFQDRLDTTYTLFVDAVAENRGMAVDAVLKAADGKIFLGAEALANGLIDVLVDDLDSFISTLTQEDTNMDLQELKAKHPALHDQIRKDALAEGRTLAETDAAQKMKEAAATSVSGVLAMVGVMATPEMSDQIKKMVDSGMTAEQLQLAAGIFGKGGSVAAPVPPATVTDPPAGVTRQDILAGLQAAGNTPVAGAVVTLGGDGPDFMTEVNAHMEANKDMTKSAAMKDMRKKHPAKYDKWIESQQSK